MTELPEHRYVRLAIFDSSITRKPRELKPSIEAIDYVRRRATALVSKLDELVYSGNAAYGDWTIKFKLQRVVEYGKLYVEYYYELDGLKLTDEHTMLTRDKPANLIELEIE